MKSKPATTGEIQAALYRNPGKRNLDIETQLVTSVLDYLAVIGIRAFRRNVGAREYLDERGRARLVRFGQAGQADVWGVGPTGVHIEIELKREGKHPSSEQLAWLDTMRRKGSIAFWCDSLRSCMEQLREEYQKRHWPWKDSWDL